MIELKTDAVICDLYTQGYTLRHLGLCCDYC